MKKNGRRMIVRWVRYQYLRTVRINDSAERIAGGFAFGVVIGILPTFGVGLVIALFLAGPLHLNRASAVIGTLVMNPWTAPFFWMLSFITGSLMLGYHPADILDTIKGLKGQGGDLWEAILTKKLILPYVLGNTAVTAASAATSYVACLMAVKAYRGEKERKRLKIQ